MFGNPFANQHRFDYYESKDNENDVDDDVDNDIYVDDEIILLFLNLEMLLDLVLLFHMIRQLAIDVCHVGLIWRFVKHLVVKMNWVMLLNNGTLYTRLSTESNGQNQYLFNYNVCKH